MIFQRKKVASALAYMLGVGGAMSLIAAPAQAADIKVDVTGSNIKRVEGEGALPVQTLTREDIERTGATTAYDLLNYISSNNSAGNVSLGNVIGATTFSAQTASLRGLGGQATLILVNGKRVQSFAGEVQGVYGVNLDVIPFSAIERVEVLKDGASAVYGSDAIGGVINFIMRQDYQGAEATAYYGSPTRSGHPKGDEWQGKATAGWGDLSKDKWNAFISGSYQEQKPLLQKDRDFSKTSYLPGIGYNSTSGNTFPAYVSTGGIGSLNFPQCGGIPGDIPVGSRCRFDPAQYDGVESIPDQKNTNFFASGRFQFNPDWQGYATGFYSKSETRFIIQPTPISAQFFYGPNGDIPANISLPPSSPFYPTAQAIAAGVNGQDLNVRYRCVLCGNRDTTDTNEGWQGVAGVKGNWKNWDLDFDYFYSEGKTREHLNGGFVRYTEVLPLLSSGLVNVFGPNSADIQNQFTAALFKEDTFKATSKNYGFEGKASADIYNLPAGPLGFAVGFMTRKEKLDQTPNPALATGDITGYGGNFLPVAVDRTNSAAFIEFSIPIVKNLEANAAVRYDHYNDFGSTTNPKISLRWNPIQQVLFRGAWGTGFIAPSLTQLHGLQTSGVSSPGLTDPVRCPVTGDGNDCDTQFGVIFGGNPALQPEKSNQWSIGTVIEPVAGFSVGVDYFDIVLKNLFSNGVTPLTILNNLGQFGNLVTRAPPDAANPNLPGRILTIDQRFINLGEVKIQGFDVDVRARFPETSFGRFTYTLNGTYYTKWDAQNTDGSFSGFVSNQYAAVVTGITPRWKHYQTLTLSYGPWSGTVAQSYQSSYIDNAAIDFADDGTPITRRVGALSIWDLYGSYSGLKNWTFTLGVKNVMDENPPLTNQVNTFQAGFDPSYYDARGRFVYGSISYAFKP
jgi:iron complex outermembrane receptor protein